MIERAELYRRMLANLARFYRLIGHIFSFGWTGANHQWKHFYGAYLYFAAFATPLVLSVHSVVSWDFAMA